MGAGTAPAAMAPRSACTHSGRLGSMMETASPGRTPSAMSARATWRTVRPASAQEMSRAPAFQQSRGPSRREVAKKASIEVIAAAWPKPRRVAREGDKR